MGQAFLMNHCAGSTDSSPTIIATANEDIKKDDIVYIEKYENDAKYNTEYADIDSADDTALSKLYDDFDLTKRGFLYAVSDDGSCYSYLDGGKNYYYDSGDQHYTPNVSLRVSNLSSAIQTRIDYKFEEIFGYGTDKSTDVIQEFPVYISPHGKYTLVYKYHKDNTNSENSGLKTTLYYNESGNNVQLLADFPEDSTNDKLVFSDDENYCVGLVMGTIFAYRLSGIKNGKMAYENIKNGIKNSLNSVGLQDSVFNNIVVGNDHNLYLIANNDGSKYSICINLDKLDTSAGSSTTVIKYDNITVLSVAPNNASKKIQLKSSSPNSDYYQYQYGSGDNDFVNIDNVCDGTAPIISYCGNILIKADSSDNTYKVYNTLNNKLSHICNLLPYDNKSKVSISISQDEKYIYATDRNSKTLHVFCIYESSVMKQYERKLPGDIILDSYTHQAIDENNTFHIYQLTKSAFYHYTTKIASNRVDETRAYLSKDKVIYPHYIAQAKVNVNTNSTGKFAIIDYPNASACIAGSYVGDGSGEIDFCANIKFECSHEETHAYGNYIYRLNTSFSDDENGNIYNELPRRFIFPMDINYVIIWSVDKSGVRSERYIITKDFSDIGAASVQPEFSYTAKISDSSKRSVTWVNSGANDEELTESKKHSFYFTPVYIDGNTLNITQSATVSKIEEKLSKPNNSNAPESFSVENISCVVNSANGLLFNTPGVTYYYIVG